MAILFKILAIVSFFSLPLGLGVFSFLVIKLFFNHAKKYLIRTWMPYVGALCVAPGIIFFVFMWDIVFNKNHFNNYNYLFFTLLAAFFSGVMFFLWLILKRIKINLSNTFFISWFFFVLFFIYPFSWLMVIEMMRV